MKIFTIIPLSLGLVLSELFTADQYFAEIILQEVSGIERIHEYIECQIQVPADLLNSDREQLIVKESVTGSTTYCQIIEQRITADKTRKLLRLIFPASLAAGETKSYEVKKSGDVPVPNSSLNCTGEGFDLVIENGFYRADLSKNPAVEPQSYDSGQIRELLVKLNFDKLLTNAEDRLHWAPNFKRPEIEWYTTIAHWQAPEYYKVATGPYMVETKRRDGAPQHPEIDLTAVYKFYDDKPWFRFYSCMEMVRDVWLELLRNDEMTMDSMFTHLAFQRPNGEIVDVDLAGRYKLLEERPIENEAPWLCFYNSQSGMAFGSIRITYDISDRFGEISPLYEPHTQIGEWLGGITYWNRRLIHDHLTYVPRGSRYLEENVYVVFEIEKQTRFKAIVSLAERLKSPVKCTIKPGI